MIFFTINVQVPVTYLRYCTSFYGMYVPVPITTD